MSASKNDGQGTINKHCGNDACATPSLSFGGRVIHAEDVHEAFLAAMRFVYARIVSTEKAMQSTATTQNDSWRLRLRVSSEKREGRMNNVSNLFTYCHCHRSHLRYRRGCGEKIRRRAGAFSYNVLQ